MPFSTYLLLLNVGVQISRFEFCVILMDGFANSETISTCGNHQHMFKINLINGKINNKKLNKQTEIPALNTLADVYTCNFTYETICTFSDGLWERLSPYLSQYSSSIFAIVWWISMPCYYFIQFPGTSILCTRWPRTALLAYIYPQVLSYITSSAVCCVGHNGYLAQLWSTRIENQNIVCIFFL